MNISFSLSTFDFRVLGISIGSYRNGVHPFGSNPRVQQADRTRGDRDRLLRLHWFFSRLIFESFRICNYTFIFFPLVHDLFSLTDERTFTMSMPASHLTSNKAFQGLQRGRSFKRSICDNLHDGEKVLMGTGNFLIFSGMHSWLSLVVLGPYHDEVKTSLWIWSHPFHSKLGFFSCTGVRRCAPYLLLQQHTAIVFLCFAWLVFAYHSRAQRLLYCQGWSFFVFSFFLYCDGPRGFLLMDWHSL